MRKLGLIGGMSWVSTQTYYQHLNRLFQASRGPLSSAPLLIENLDFSAISRLSTDLEWAQAAEVLIASARRLTAAGAGALVISANSMHRVFDRVAEAVDVPIFHIADCVGDRMRQDGVEIAALLGSRNVMTEGFYRERLIDHGVKLLPPLMENVDVIDRIIYDELMQGKATRSSQRILKSIITAREQAGAKAVVLGCTELEMIVPVDANVLPIYDSTRIHAEVAANWLIGR